jgi:hypothetical protein
MCNVGGTGHNSKPHQHLKFEKTTDVLVQSKIDMPEWEQQVLSKPRTG